MAATLALMSLMSCASDEAPPTGVTDPTLVPDPTALAPGACDPSEAVDAPSIETAGVTTLATLGLADVGCAGTNGDGYISFNYNPVIIEGEESVTVRTAEGVSAILDWTGAVPFVESEPGTWTTTLEPSSCNRLTIRLTSASGASTATYGADIRVGGEAIECPQRVIDPSDVPGDSGGTLAPPVKTTDPSRSTVAGG